MGQEQRLSARLDYDEMVEVHAVHSFPPAGTPPALSEPLHLKSKNLSKDGICLETGCFFIPNHIFQLSFDLLDQPIRTLARVVWSERTACGMQFLKPGDFRTMGGEEGKDPPNPFYLKDPGAQS